MSAWPGRPFPSWAVVNGVGWAVMVCAVAVAEISASVSTVDSVVKLKGRPMLATFRFSAFAICR